MIFKITWLTGRRRLARSAGGGTLADLPCGARAVVGSVGGERPFRRRLMEMGLVPGTTVAVVNVAPLGDPIEIELRHSRISIRRLEAGVISVET